MRAHNFSVCTRVTIDLNWTTIIIATVLLLETTLRIRSAGVWQLSIYFAAARSSLSNLNIQFDYKVFAPRMSILYYPTLYPQHNHFKQTWVTWQHTQSVNKMTHLSIICSRTLMQHANSKPSELLPALYALFTSVPCSAKLLQRIITIVHLGALKWLE